MSALRTTAAIVAAIALVAIALFTYQSAQAEQEAACWAEAHTRNDVAQANLESLWVAVGDGGSTEKRLESFQEMFVPLATKADFLFDKCVALR